MTGREALSQTDDGPCAFTALLSPNSADAVALRAMALAQGQADAVHAAARKRYESLRAQCALLRHMPGTMLHQLEDDVGRPQFIVTWQALTRAFSDLDEVEAWLHKVAGPQA